MRFFLFVAACHRPSSPVVATDTFVELHTPAFVPERFGVERPADVRIRAEVDVARQDVWGSADVVDGDRIVAHLQPGEAVELGEVEGPVAVEVLPLPPADAIGPGQTVRRPMVPVAEGDPRGPLVDLSFELTEPTWVQLGWRAVHEGPDHQAPHALNAVLVSPSGRQSATLHITDDDPSRGGLGWELEPGRHVLRLTPDDMRRGISCEVFETPWGAVEPPAWCALPDDDGPWEVEVSWEEDRPGVDVGPGPEPRLAVSHVLSVGPHTVGQRPAPDQATHRFPVSVGADVVVKWTPEDVPLGYRWEVHEDWWSSGACDRGACRFWAVPFDAVDIELWPGETARHVTLAVFERPSLGEVVDIAPGVLTVVELDDPEDLRGPYADVMLRVDVPGRYRLGVTHEEGAQVFLEPLDASGLVDTGLQYFGPDPYDMAIYDVEEAGLYRVRLYTAPEKPPRTVEVEWTVE